MTGVIVAGGRTFVPFALLAQMLAGCLVAAVAGAWFGQTAAVSALLGGLAVVVPNAFLALMLLTADLEALMRAAWIGEVGKLALTTVLFALIFALVRPISPAAALAGLIGAQLVLLLAGSLWRPSA
jgi:ATP synthase protein I